MLSCRGSRLLGVLRRLDQSGAAVDLPLDARVATRRLLSAGLLVDGTVTCPWHGWTYDVRTGKSIVPPIGLRVPTYPVLVVGNEVFVEIDWG